MHPALHSKSLQKLPLSIRRFAISAHRSDASIEMVHRALDFAHGDAPFAQRIALLPVSYVHLDPDKVPNPEDLESGSLDPQTTQVVSKAISAWRGLFAIFFDLPFAALPALWPRISSWALVFNTYREQLQSLPMASKLYYRFHFTFASMTRIIHREHESVRAAIFSLPGLASLLGPAWAEYAAIETDEELDLNVPVLESLCALLPDLAAASLTTLRDLADSVGGTNSDVALFLVRSLHAHTILKEVELQTWYTDRLLDFMCEVDDITVCCHKDRSLRVPITPLLLAAIRHRFVYHIMRVACMLSAADDDGAQETINHCLMVVIRAILNSGVPTALDDALDGGLISVLAGAVKWGSKPCIANRVRSFVSILPPLLVTHKTLALMNRGLTEAEPTYRSKSFRTSYIGPAWAAMVQFAQQRIHVFKTISTAQSQLRAACDNLECGKIDHRKLFRRCSGCLSFYYCSETCQQVDWVDGGHRSACSLYTNLIPNESDALYPSCRNRTLLRALLQNFYDTNYADFYSLRLLRSEPDSEVLAIPFIDFSGIYREFNSPPPESVKIYFINAQDGEVEDDDPVSHSDSESSSSSAETDSTSHAESSEPTSESEPGSTHEECDDSGLSLPVPRDQTTPPFQQLAARPEWADLCARARRSNGTLELHAVRVIVLGKLAVEHLCIVPLRRNASGRLFRARLTEELGSHARDNLSDEEVKEEIHKIRNECGDVVEMY
ncbi:hypothetical protein C8F01DRAFT_1125943 [Mycena amicta]|nr:hypothetical protein C8F01DRAFT_1125943 [Mycena amicta]